MASESQLKPLLTIAVSSRALFHMEDGNAIWESKGQKAYNRYMRDKENVPLRQGTAFPLVKKLLALNTDPNKPLIDVILLSRNSPDAGVRVFKSIAHYDIPLKRANFTQGANRFAYIKAFQADLFLSANSTDVKNAIDNGVAAATLAAKETINQTDTTIKIAFDGDSVLFGSEADDAYRALGLEHFIAHENEKQNIPLDQGPFHGFAMALKKVQNAFPEGECPIKLGLVTARGIQSSTRVFTTLRHWGLHLDEVVFCAGMPKGPLLRAFGADIFFDDTTSNLTSALEYDVNSGHVPFGTGGIQASSGQR